MAAKKFISNSVWILSFHTITSLFYLRMLFIFMSTKNIILAGRMITTWYLAFHIGFIFLRLIQDLIKFSRLKNSKFDEIFTKFNNLVFISLILPFALYIPLVYWLLFCYDSNLMLPNFVEISLPTWVCMSSHTIIASVALVEMTTTKYSYEGNHFSSFIIMSIFSAGYFVCLVGTYVQYGFWLYPIFHLLPSKCLPFVFLMLMALLLFMYFVGKVVVHRFHAIDESNEKFEKDDAKELSPISSGNISEVQNNDPLVDLQFKDEKYTGSSLLILKKILQKVIILPLRSNIQKMFLDENHYQSLINSRVISSRGISNLDEYENVDDSLKSQSHLTVKNEHRIPLRITKKSLKRDDELQLEENEQIAEQKNDGKYRYAIEATDDDHTLSISLISNKKNSNVSQSISTNQNDYGQLTLKENNENSIFSSQFSHDYDFEAPSSLISISSFGSVDDYDIYETGDERCPSYEIYENYEVQDDKPLTTENFYTDNVSIKHQAENNKKQDRTFRFRLQLFPNDSREISPQNEQLEETQNFIEENSRPKMIDVNPKNEILTKPLETDTEKKVQTENQKIGGSLTNGKYENFCFACNNSRKFQAESFPKISASKFEIHSCLKTIPTLRRSISPKLVTIHDQKGPFKNNACENTSLKERDSKTLDSNTNFNVVLPVDYSTIKKPKEKKNQQCLRNYEEIKTIGNSNKLDESSCCNEVLLKSCTREQNFLNSLSRCLRSKMQQKFVNDSAIDPKSNEKIKENKRKKYRCCKAKSRNGRQQKFDKKICKTDAKEKYTNESENERKKFTIELKKVTFHKSDESEELNENKRINVKSKFCEEKENKTKDRIKKFCRHNSKKDGLRECFKKKCDGNFNIFKDNKCACKKVMKIEGNESSSGSSTSSVHKCRSHCAPKPCEELNKKKSKKVKNLEDENPRYEILPQLKRNTPLKKVNFTRYSIRATEKQCKRRKTTEKEIKMDKPTHDLSNSRECPADRSNQVGDNTKKKFMDRFFNCSKRNQRTEDEKEVDEILKKYINANGSKIGAIFTLIPGNNELQPNVNIDNAETLQNLQTSLFSDDSKRKISKQLIG